MLQFVTSVALSQRYTRWVDGIRSRLRREENVTLANIQANLIDDAKLTDKDSKFLVAANFQGNKPNKRGKGDKPMTKCFCCGNKAYKVADCFHLNPSKAPAGFKPSQKFVDEYKKNRKDKDKPAENVVGG